MNRPTCPKCGVKARIVILKKARVRCVLNDDGTIGSVISASRGGTETGFECGGGHTWNKNEEQKESEP